MPNPPSSLLSIPVSMPDSAAASPLSPRAGGTRPAYADLPPSTRAPVSAAYVHVPFCTSKCHYCDFYSVAGHLDQADAYLKALATEMDLQFAHFGGITPQTLFIGGGTPTLLDPTRLDRLLSIIESRIDRSRLTEFTIEANPNTFDGDRARVLASHGVNRISFGAQSFLRHELAILQRDHDPDNVAVAMTHARNAGISNLNIDLIFGTPGQTLADWSFSLQSAIALRPDHLSAYSLIYEPNTPMTARMHAGEFAPLDESTELAIFQHTYDTLRAAGYGRYEVSNYSLPGRECQHNLHYWKGANFLAFGPAAAAGYDGYRWKNIASISHYLGALAGPAPVVPATQMEHLPPVRRAGELAMLLLRLTEGLNYSEFETLTTVDPLPRLAPILRKYAGLEFLQETAGGIHITDAGVPVSDHILADILAAFA